MSKLQSHVGMNFKSPTVNLFSFQLVRDGLAHGHVDFVNGIVDRVLVTPDLVPRADAVVRLAEIHCRRNQK